MVIRYRAQEQMACLWISGVSADWRTMELPILADAFASLTAHSLPPLPLSLAQLPALLRVLAVLFVSSLGPLLTVAAGVMPWSPCRLRRL